MKSSSHELESQDTNKKKEKCTECDFDVKKKNLFEQK